MKIFSETEEWVCLEKPADVSCSAVVAALHEARFGEKFSAIYTLDQATSGFLVCAKTLAARDALKNAYGSDLFTFTFYGWGRMQHVCPQNWECDLSIAWDPLKNRAYPSKTNGKKAKTSFAVQNVFGNHLSFIATTHYLRPQQLQIHAHFSHFDILGDSMWIPRPHYVYLKDLKDFVKNASDEPITSGLHLALGKIQFPYKKEAFEISFPLPAKWIHLQKILQKYAS